MKKKTERIRHDELQKLSMQSVRLGIYFKRPYNTGYEGRSVQTEEEAFGI